MFSRLLHIFSWFIIRWLVGSRRQHSSLSGLPLLSFVCIWSILNSLYYFCSQFHLWSVQNFATSLSLLKNLILAVCYLWSLTGYQRKLYLLCYNNLYVPWMTTVSVSLYFLVNGAVSGTLIKVNSTVYFYYYKILCIVTKWANGNKWLKISKVINTLCPNLMIKTLKYFFLTSSSSLFSVLASRTHTKYTFFLFSLPQTISWKVTKLSLV